ncbi:hypothetical protein BDZ97DRAFT_1760070 [Flammula alnicola]|nr:hypothetical protein BDZ97DRAFT_1760070 [Flammula alnicola]
MASHWEGRSGASSLALRSLFDETHGTALKTALEATVGTGMDELAGQRHRKAKKAHIYIAQIEEFVELDSMVRKCAEESRDGNERTLVVSGSRRYNLPPKITQHPNLSSGFALELRDESLQAVLISLDAYKSAAVGLAFPPVWSKSRQKCYTSSNVREETNTNFAYFEDW